jgi:hypothetical protein
MGSASSSTSQNFDMRTDQSGGFYAGAGSVTTPGGGVAINVQGGSGTNSGASPSFAGAEFGFGGEDVAAMFREIDADRADERKVLSDISTTLADSAASQGQVITETLSAVKTPDANTLQQLIPVVIVIGIVLAVVGLARG